MEKEEKLKEMVLSVIERSPHTREILTLLGSLDITKEEVLDGYIYYNLDVNTYSNEIYEHLETRFTEYIQNLLPKSWHIKRQETVLEMIKLIKPKSIVDMGFGIPGKYVGGYVLKNKIKLTLVDFNDSAFKFAENLLNIRHPTWKENIFFKKLDMNHGKYVGDFDCYILMDSIEHVKESSKYLKRIVKKSRPGSKFILSLPIGPKIPSHTIEWKNEVEAIKWLERCGLVIDKKEKVFPNPEVDLFVEGIEEELYNLIVTCSKKYALTNLPLLEEVKNLHSGESLENTLLIVCHHILSSNLVLLDYLIKLKIKPENIYLIGKSYSTCSKTMEDYIRLGVNVDEKSLSFDSHLSFDEQFSKYIKEFLIQIMKKDLSKYDRIIILDDGGQLIIHASEFFKGDKRVVGIEQTSSGYNRINKIELGFPVINVATSRAKLDHETPLIVEAMSKEIYKRIRQINKNVGNVLIIGNGPIGRGLAEDLRKDFIVSIYDKDPEKTEISEKEFPTFLTGCDLIVGCSGEKGILESFYPLLKKNVLLASASSSDREFESHRIRRRHPKIPNPHMDFHDEDVILLNGGFPLNFDGHRLSVPLEDIQLTEALMFAATIQALKTPHEKKIIELDSSIQDLIVDKFESL